MIDLAELAGALGFGRVCVFPNEPFPHYMCRQEDGALHKSARQLCGAPQETNPWANAIAALLMPYKPFADTAMLSGYYIGSNAAYHAVNALIEALKEHGVRAERVHVPVRELLTRTGVGVRLQNGLTAVEPFGSRFAVQTLVLALEEPLFEPMYVTRSCDSCGACAKACPTNAISQDGFRFDRCVRAYMDGETMPIWAMDAMTSLLGCERCQSACPYNSKIESLPTAPSAFALERLLDGDIGEALSQIGTNQRKNGRIQQHAAIIAAKQQRRELIPLIEPLLNDPREAVRTAAEYALAQLDAIKRQ